VYITNPDKLPQDKIYWCNGIVAEWLIYEKHFPLLSKDGRRFGFAKTEKLENVLKDLPIWLRVVTIIF
jgi:hypothetical protein